MGVFVAVGVGVCVAVGVAVVVRVGVEVEVGVRVGVSGVTVSGVRVGVEVGLESPSPLLEEVMRMVMVARARRPRRTRVVFVDMVAPVGRRVARGWSARGLWPHGDKSPFSDTKPCGLTRRPKAFVF
jgi:hypothetical protein